SARPRSTTSAGRTCRQASSAAARPRPPSSRSRRETAPPRCDRPPQSPPHCSTSKYQKPQKLRYDPSRLILLALRLCPANPGNPRNRIEGESPHSGKDIRSSLVAPWSTYMPRDQHDFDNFNPGTGHLQPVGRVEPLRNPSLGLTIVGRYTRGCFLCENYLSCSQRSPLSPSPAWQMPRAPTHRHGGREISTSRSRPRTPATTW